MTIKTIHFILPGGGVRGSFQAGFLYKLFTNYKELFTIYKIDGTSVGAINGIAIICKKYLEMKNTWLTIYNINDLFGKWSNIPILRNLSCLYYAYYNNGLYNNKHLYDKLSRLLDSSINNCHSEDLEKFSCTVTNVTKSKLEYINGTSDNILNYIVASASPWIISNPVKLDNMILTDGGILETYPIKYVDISKADLIIIVGFDHEIIQLHDDIDCKNIVSYLARLIDIARINSVNTLKLANYIQSGKCIPIINTMKASLLDFNNEVIQKGFNDGEEAAVNFAKTYLI